MGNLKEGYAVCKCKPESEIDYIILHKMCICDLEEMSVYIFIMKCYIKTIEYVIDFIIIRDEKRKENGYGLCEMRERDL